MYHLHPLPSRFAILVEEEQHADLHPLLPASLGNSKGGGGGGVDGCGVGDGTGGGGGRGSGDDGGVAGVGLSPLQRRASSQVCAYACLYVCMCVYVCVDECVCVSEDERCLNL